MIIVRSIGERTMELCAAQLPNPVIIKDVFPFSEALRRCFRMAIQSGEKRVLCIDADIVLYSGIHDQMMTYLKDQGERCYSAIYWVMDKFYSIKSGIHAYNVSLLSKAAKLIRDDVKRPEAHVVGAMCKRGFILGRSNLVCGVHGFAQYFRDIYRTHRIRKWKNRSMSEQILSRWREMAENDPDFLVAIEAHERPLRKWEKSVDARKADLDAVSQILAKYGLVEKCPIKTIRAISNFDDFMLVMEETDL